MTDAGVNYRAQFEAAMTFDEYLDKVQKHADLWRGIYARAEVHASEIAAIEATGRDWHLLVLSEDWCGDAVNTVPVVARLAGQARNVDMRVLARDANLDVMDAHLSPTGGRAIPVVIVLDESYEEIGWWGSRPAPLQAWYLSEGNTLEKDARYKHARGWYARDKGASVVAALLEMIQKAGAV